MIRTEQSVLVVTYTSSVHPELSTTNEAYADVIEWADAEPDVWRVVRGKSKPFGTMGSHYIACGRGGAVENVLYRAREFRAQLERPNELRDGSIFGWRARFTLDHVRDKGFRGDLFQQFDGTYPRGAIDLDYTADTLDAVIERFLLWCGPQFPTRSVRVGLKDRTVASFDPALPYDELRKSGLVGAREARAR